MPVITSNITSVSVITDPGLSTALTTWTEPTATDNSNVYTMTSSHDSGSSFPIGITTVTYTAVDEAGNIATYSFNVSVKGTDLLNPFLLFYNRSIKSIFYYANRQIE